MSLRTLESEIRACAMRILENRKLRLKDIMEWSNMDIAPREDEVVIRIPHLGINVAVKKECDKRKEQTP